MSRRFLRTETPRKRSVGARCEGFSDNKDSPLEGHLNRAPRSRAGLRRAEGTLMRKPNKQSAEPVGWKVYIMRAKLTLVGFVDALDKQEALDKAMRELNIREADRFRITVRRE